MSEFTDFLHEVFEQLGPISLRRMFGGYGVYHDGLMFAIVFDDSLYLRADDRNLGYFRDAGLGPFEYVARGKTLTLSYYLAPDALFDDRGLAAEWGRRSCDAALRKRATKRKPRGRGRR